MTKIVLCDVPNTLFDSRHRTTNDTLTITGIDEDVLNYAAYSLLKDLHKSGYAIVLTHYCLSRVSHKIEALLKKHISFPYKLYTNYASQSVYNNQTLKQKVYTDILKDNIVKYVIDNDETLKSYWLEESAGLLTCPLEIYKD